MTDEKVRADGLAQVRDKLYAEIARRVKSLREKRGLTRAQLAKRVNIAESTIRGIEDGSRGPGLAAVYAIAAALGVRLTAILPAVEDYVDVNLEGGE